jgi:hypothetical protein
MSITNSDQSATGLVLYTIDTSIRVEGSHSRAIANIVEQEWGSAHPEEPIIRRHIGVDPIPAMARGKRVERAPRETDRVVSPRLPSTDIAPTGERFAEPEGC